MDFDLIRPYNDKEISLALKSLKGNKSFEQLVKFFIPDWDNEEVDRQLDIIDSYDELYRKILFEIARQTEARTTQGLSYSGLDKLNKKENFLFISNHRDIITDSGFLNYILFNNGFSFLESAIGNNLLGDDWLTHLVKINQNFLVLRDVERHELYKSSLALSSYMEHVLREKNKNVWIAQREGRTKNGSDKTQVGVIKMIGLNGDQKNLAAYYNSLNIVPVAISYEIEPCVMSKVNEQVHIANEGSYEKEYDEDLRSMISGVISQKGRVHYSFGKAIKIDESANFHRREVVEKVVAAINHHIHESYRLWPNNYIAYDRLEENERAGEIYTAQESVEFTEHVYNELTHLPVERDKAKKIMWELYANPVINKERIESKSKDLA